MRSFEVDPVVAGLAVTDHPVPLGRPVSLSLAVRCERVTVTGAPATETFPEAFPLPGTVATYGAVPFGEVARIELEVVG